MRKQKLCPTKNGALEWEATQRKILKKNPGCETSIICLLDWANQYLKYAEAKFTDSVFREKKVIFKRFFRSVSSTLLVEELDMGRTIGYFQVQKKKRSGNASNKDRKYLHAAWEWGVKYIQGFPKYSVNPFKTDKMPETRHPRYVPPEKDLWAVLEQAQGQDQLMLLAFLHTAARRDELFNLRWADVHFDTQEISLWTRKSGDGSMKERRLPMTDEMLKALLEHRQHSGSVWVFPNPETDEPYVDRKKSFKALCIKAGVKPFGFHAIRHLTPSILLRLGADPKAIQAVMGHEKFSTTERYLHRLIEVREAVRLLPGKLRVLPGGTSKVLLAGTSQRQKPEQGVNP
jgi:integrase